MNIRLATLDDAEIINEMYLEICAFINNWQPEDYKSGEAIERFKQRHKYAETCIENANHDIIIAEIDENAVGFAHVVETETLLYKGKIQHKFAVCTNLFYRKNEIREALLNAAKDCAKKRNLDYIKLPVLGKRRNKSKMHRIK